MIAHPDYVRRVQALPDPSAAMQTYIAATLANDGSVEGIDAAQAACQALTPAERDTLHDIGRQLDE